MLKAIALWAYRLDTWLEEKLGRPYNAALSVGLIAEVIHNVLEMPAKLRFTEHLFWELFQIVFASILLVHQIGALSHRFQARDRRAAGH
jgi:hypothetical protein